MYDIKDIRSKAPDSEWWKYSFDIVTTPKLVGL
jgi:hypothetical protein